MGLESKSGTVDVGLARGSGGRGQCNAMWVCMNEMGGNSGEDEHDDAAECRDDIMMKVGSRRWADGNVAKGQCS